MAYTAAGNAGPETAGEVYAAVEAPKGEFGVYLVADGAPGDKDPTAVAELT